MGKVNISGGGVRANVKALVDLPADRLWAYSAVDNEVQLCGAGAEADGITLESTVAGELLNAVGVNYSRKNTGVYADVNIVSIHTAGDEFMSNANGQITDHTGTDLTNRALGKFLTSGAANTTGKVLLYGR